MTRPVVGTVRPCAVAVCRGCCCGDPCKHPGTDHAWQVEQLCAAAASGGRFTVRTTDCRGPCDQGNIIVVQPSSAGRRAGGRTTWIGFAVHDACTDDVVRWAEAGGPGVAAPATALELQFIRPPHEARPGTRR